MPLIWCLRLAGARLHDRVYGPTFMRQFLAGVPPDFTHYLLGSSEACGAQLRAVFSKLNPGIRFIGSFHGKCSTDGRLEGAADQQVIEEINRLSPDLSGSASALPNSKPGSSATSPACGVASS